MEQDDNGGFDFEEYLRSLGGKEPEGIFLKNVKPEDLDENGRFICKKPVLIIGANAFRKVWDKLTYVKIDGVISIEDDAFANCGKLERADIGFELGYRYLKNYDAHMYWKDRTIDSEEQYNMLLEEFCAKFGEYQVNIKDNAFKNCISLKSFHFPPRVVLYGSPFRRCNSMTEVTFDGPVTLRIGQELLDALDEDDVPLRTITFKDCNNVQKINFGKGFMFHIDEIAEFENLKEVNLNCDFFARRNFWENAVSAYPHFFLMLPTDLYRDASFAKRCLREVPEVLEEIYGYPESKFIYKNILSKKAKIEKQKAKQKKSSLSAKCPKYGGGTSRTR